MYSYASAIDISTVFSDNIYIATIAIVYTVEPLLTATPEQQPYAI